MEVVIENMHFMVTEVDGKIITVTHLGIDCTTTFLTYFWSQQ